MTTICKLTFLLVLCLPFVANAQLPDQLKQDFSISDGYIIMAVADEYLVDLDATDNLREGDILSLIVPGEKVIHPITKEILGSLDVAQGYLQVTRIKAGYSYAKLLSTGVSPQKGDQVRRFDQVPAVFIGEQSELSQQLVGELPQLDWLPQQQEKWALLRFTLTNGVLSVVTQGNPLAKSYKVSDELRISSSPEQRNQQQSEIIRNQKTSDKPVWYGPNLDGNPVGITVADLDGDGLKETAIALDNYILICSIQQGQFTQEAKIELSSSLNILSLDHYDLDNDQIPELYLSAAKGPKLASLVVKFSAGNYVVAVENVPWFVRVVDLPEAGTTLVGQLLTDEDNPLKGEPFLVVSRDNKLDKGKPIKLPKRVNLFNFIPFVDDKGTSLSAYLTKGDYLKAVSLQGEELWESSSYFGGSETSFYAQAESENEMVSPTYIPPRLLKTGSGDILVAQNDGQRTMQRFRMYKESRVVALRWNGFAFDEQWSTSSQKGYLADFALADIDNDGKNEVVMAMKFKHKGLFSKAKSTIVYYELD